ncbi:MAG: hypothetical protein QOH61_2817 [Chloroflexota bacterium]|jgi:hypothetical protein|nr:hypothetical protein [Chloroflexota bacterium]
MERTALVASTAANLAGWHDLMVRALGHAARHVEGLWLTPERVPPIFFSAIAVRPGASGFALADGMHPETWIAVCDPWADLDLQGRGFTVEGDHPWMVRAAGPAPLPAGPSGLTIERVLDAAGLADFELASAHGFGSPPQPAFTWHAPSVLADPRLALWRGCLDGQTVSTSMSFVHAGVVGIYGVSTLLERRRRGFATALTRAAITADPSLPSVLQPSSMAEPLYRALGFERFTTFRTWVRAAGSTPERISP